MRVARCSAALLAVGLLLPAPVTAQVTNPWTIRARAVLIAPDASSKPAGLDVKSDATMELDISRRFSDLFAAELILASSGHEVETATASLGSVQVLPPTLLLQVHPVRSGSLRPYVGAGGNLTIFYGKSGGLEDLDLSTSIGYALQGGMDVLIGGRGLFNVDFKYVNIKTDVESNGTLAYELTVNPMVIGVGFGYRF